MSLKIAIIPIFCDVENAKKYLCCGTTHLYKLLKNREILMCKDGAKTLIVVESLTNYADRLLAKAA